MRPRLNQTHDHRCRLLLGGLLILVVVALPGSGASGAAWAEMRGHGNADDFIAETADLLDWAQGIVEESGNRQAMRVLEEVGRLQERSRRLVDQGRPEMAMRVAKRARAAIYHAVRLARESMMFGERFQMMIEHNTEMRRDLQDRARTGDNRMALDMLDRAETLSLRAREQYRQGDAKQAYRMLEQVEALQGRIAGMLGRGPGPEEVDMKLAQTAALLEKAQGMPGDDPGRRDLLGDAAAALDKARDLQARGMPGQALQMGGMARRLIDQAMRGPDEFQGPEVVRRHIDRWDDRASNLRARLEDHRDRDLDEQWRKARDHRMRAASLLDQGKPLMALRQIKLAHDLLDEVERRLR